MRENQEVREEDRKVIHQAAASAKRLRPELDPELFDFLEDLLLMRHPGELETEWVMRFQQLTGPATAKGIEDTAFYCFNRLICLNEVGGDPSCFGISVPFFHAAMTEAARLRPYSMLATSTHDTKRSEDVRARLALLSEIPGAWIEAVGRWSRHNEQYRQGSVPDRNAEYLFYQTLVGAWPIETERVLTFVEKAAREAKAYTSWTQPDEDYEKALYAMGRQADHVVAFLRGGEVGVVAPRLPLAMNGGGQDTWLEIPEGRWRDHLTGDRFNGGKVTLGAVLALISKEQIHNWGKVPNPYGFRRRCSNRHGSVWLPPEAVAILSTAH